jgi:two-component system sensor histidine kinase UhpB
LIPSDHQDEEELILQRIKRGERVEHFETVRVAKDGRLVDVSIAASPVKDGAGNITGGSKVARDITERKRADAGLRSRSARLQQLSRQLMQVQEQERRRLGRELHDRTGANLSALLLSLEVLRGKLPPDLPEAFRSRISNCGVLLRETITQVRDVLAELRPPALDELGLLAALNHYVRLVAQLGNTEVSTEGREPSPRLPPDVEISLFRIAQEALNNATRHAQATHIVFALRPEAAQVTLTVTDDGKGFDASSQRPGSPSLGLVTMRERAEAMSARLIVETSPGKGTRIIVTVPYQTTPGQSG